MKQLFSKITSIIIVTLLGTIVIFGQTSNNIKKKNDNHESNNNNKDSIFKKIQGTWVLERDSLAYLKISKKKWHYRLAWEKANKSSKYNIEITNNYTPLVDKNGKEIFIILTNKADTMRYEIISVTDQMMSLIYYPSGNNYIYRKKEGKLKFDKSTKINHHDIY